MSELETTVGVTNTARNKSDRMLGEYWLRYEVNRLVTEYPDNQDLYRKGALTDEYHIVFPAENYVIVVIDNVDASLGYSHLIVVTQMHAHDDYEEEPIFHYVDEETWATMFGNRVPADEDQNRIRKALAVDKSVERVTSAIVGVDEMTAP